MTKLTKIKKMTDSTGSRWLGGELYRTTKFAHNQLRRIFVHFCPPRLAPVETGPPRRAESETGHFRRFCHYQSGQTLIETLAAIFMLTMGVSAALGLALYAFHSSTNITKQVIATGLAREGIEAVKAMRDTNWLQQTTVDTNCYDFTSAPAGQATAVCYKNWLGDNNNSVTPYCLNPTGNRGNCNGSTGSGTYLLTFDGTVTGNSFWKLTNDVSSNYGLRLDKQNSGNQGFYYSPSPNGTNCADGAGMSDFCRKIGLSLDFTPPYNHPSSTTYDRSDLGPMLKVQSYVWWVDKRCPRVTDFSLANPACRVEIDAYLTNWKNY